jgi:O-antigen/teichoic acid export membrane protein
VTALRERVIRDTMLYTSANVFAMAVGIGVSLMTKSILGAVGAGYWALLKVSQSYGEYSDLGVRDALLRDVPQALGAGDRDRAARLQDGALAFIAASAAAASAVIALAALFAVADPVLKKGLLGISLLVIATHAYSYWLNLLRLLKKVPALCAVIVVNILLVAVFSIAGAKAGGVLGLTAGMLVSTTLAAFFAARAAGERVRPRWNGAEIAQLVRVGFPMMILSTTLVTFLSIDSLMIGRMIGIRELGYYTIALMSIQQIGALGRFTLIVVFPHIQERYGKTGSLADSAGYFLRTTHTLRLLLPMLIGACTIFVPAIVHYLLPQFEPGIGAMKILAAGYYFVAVNEMAQTVLYTTNRQKRLIPVYAALALTAALLIYLFIRAGWGIEGAAAATSIAYFLFFAAVFALSFGRLVGAAATLRLAASTVGVFAYFIGCLLLVERFVRLEPVWLEALARFACFAVSQAPFLWKIERDEKIFSSVGTILRNRGRLAGA